MSSTPKLALYGMGDRDANAIRANLRNQLEDYRAKITIHEAVKTALEPFHGKQVTTRMQSAVKGELAKIMPKEPTVSYQPGSNDWDFMTLSIWNAGRIDYNNRYYTNLCKRRERESFNYGDWVSSSGYESFYAMVEKLEAILDESNLEERVKKYNEAYESLLDAAEYFDAFSYAVWPR